MTHPRDEWVELVTVGDPTPRPILVRDGREVEIAEAQALYGHRARKRTWLYYVGPQPATLRWHEPRVAAKVSGFKHLATGEYVADESKRVRTAEAQATPIEFRDELLALARSARTAEVAA